ncbi:hypothetical protein, partial [Intestinibacter sp.]
MYINFEKINPTLLNSLAQKFNLDSNKTTVLYKITNVKENKFDEFEKSIFPYLFIDNIYYIGYEDSIYKITSKLESSTKTSTEDIISSIKIKISKNDIFKMYNNLNSLFTIFKDDRPQSQV